MAGNVTYDGQNDYAYDGEGRLCAAYNILLTRLTDYVYDADGLRVAKGSVGGLSTPSSPMNAAVYCNLETTGNFSLSAQYLLNAAGDQVTEVDGAGSNLVWAHTNIWTGGSLDATYDPKGLHFHLKDPLGTLRVQVAAGGGAAGGTEQTCFSLPFGDALNCVDTALATADDASGLHFTGKERDTESGNDYFGARYYASSMGRFLQPDWSAKVDPVPYAKLDDPQSLNLYSYVWNNPLSRTDPDGHQCDTCQKVWNWLTSSHSASASASATAGQGGASNGFLSANARGGTAQASASASYGLNTSASAKASASVAEATVNEGTHSTSQMNGVTANAGASVGVGLGGKAGVGVSASAGANADVLTASQTEKINIGPVTITGGASGAVGIGANASVSLGTGGVGASAGAAFGYGGGLSINISWGGVAGTAGASVKGTMDSTTTTINKPEVQPQ